MPLRVPTRAPDSDAQRIFAACDKEWMSFMSNIFRPSKAANLVLNEWPGWLLFSCTCFYLENFLKSRKVWRIIKNRVSCTHYHSEPLVTFFFHICFRVLMKEIKHTRLMWPFVLYLIPILLYLFSEMSTIMNLLWMPFMFSYTFTYKYMHQPIQSRS